MQFRISPLLVIFFCGLSALGQTQMHGVLTQKDNGLPIAFANVFIAGTEIGTVSDEKGQYILKKIPLGQVELVISHIGFEPLTFKLLVPAVQELEMNWELTPYETATVEVDIESKRSFTWKRRLSRFKKGFLGRSPLAQKCELLNPEVLQFTEKNGVLIAQSSHLLEVKNQATGFKVLFRLEGYRQEGKLVSYTGKPFFQALIPKSERIAKNWNKNREIAYLGSPRHFYYSILQKSLKDEGFEVYQVKRNTIKNNFDRVKRIEPQSIPSKDSSTWKIPIDHFLEIVYGKEMDWRIQGGGSTTSQEPSKKGSLAAKSNAQRNQISWLKTQKKHLLVDSTGNLLEQKYTLEFGFWAEEKIAELLPRTYRLPKEKLGKQNILRRNKTSGPRKNTFLLEPISVSLNEIQAGGPPKDGITSIDRPRFVSVEKSGFVKDNDMVLGLMRNGIAKAYPIFIMDRHEVVNDRFDVEDIIVSYCPLCGSGMSFLVENKAGERASFGVSGLLYNSNLLLYDRETESLWSQILGKAICGPRMGDSLIYLSTTLTTWKNWRTTYPNSLVLKKPVNSLIDYRENPYRGYEDEQRLAFQVSENSRKLQNKTRVLGIKVKNQTIAYAYPEIKKAKHPIHSEINGVSFTIHYDDVSGSVKLESDQLDQLEFEHVYWFAWYAFYPETEIWNRKKK